MDPAFFNADFWRQVVTTLLGVIFGIPAALWVTYFGNKLWHRLFLAGQESSAKRAREVQMCQALFAALERNLLLVNQIQVEFDREFIPSFNVDLTVLDATAAAKYEQLTDWELCQHIDLIRSELDHVSRKMNLLVQVTHDPTARGLRIPTEGGASVPFVYAMLPQLTGAIKLHLPILKSNLEAGIQTLAKVLCKPLPSPQTKESTTITSTPIALPGNWAPIDVHMNPGSETAAKTDTK